MVHANVGINAERLEKSLAFDIDHRIDSSREDAVQAVLDLTDGRGADSTQVERAFELAISPRFPTRQFLTHVLPLSEINEAIRLPRTGEALKVALLPQQRPAA